MTITPSLSIRPILDPDFLPAAVWNRSFLERARAEMSGELGIAVIQDAETTVVRYPLLRHEGDKAALNLRFAERVVKFLLWQKGGYRVCVQGPPALTEALANIYSPQGRRSFDHEFMGEKIYGKPFSVESVSELPEKRQTLQSLGGHLDGCRIGFDLGGSDRKCAAVIDGEVVHSEEVPWDPYFQKDPAWHYAGIQDSLQRAAFKLPKVDAIGGSSAGVYVGNEVRVASLFRGVLQEDFNRRIRPIFHELKKEWGNIPFEVVNDGEVTALAGSMSLGDGAVLGIAMGTSLAAGYVTPDGHLTSGLDELAFVPVDYRLDAPRDEWSGDLGVGAQYFSQQAVARLAPLAGLEFPDEMPLPERLVEVQHLMKKNDPRAEKIYRTIGTYFGYAVAHFCEFYEVRHILLLGRVMSGHGGELIVEEGRRVLGQVFPDLLEKVDIVTPGEKEKRHGQAVAAASLPELDS
jgi:predicted NBD/HSP70 family sugar kinase